MMLRTTPGSGLKNLFVTTITVLCVIVFSGLPGQGSVFGQLRNSVPDERKTEPVVTGYGVGLFVIGEQLYHDPFEDDEDWVVQIQETGAESEPRVNFGSGSLDVLMPDRGATIWNRNKFTGPVAITYNVKAPEDYTHMNGIVARDMNSFWHASDPENPEAIFDSDNYTGAFDSYHKQQGYYASMGGRDNTTTRFRRYPRINIDGEPAEHISLSEWDGLENFLIQPGKTHTIQLVVYKDVVQYIVDGRVFYEIREGDSITVLRADGREETAIYTAERFPPYEGGWFGFRLVNSHHQYSGFRVYRLEPDE